MLSPYRLDIPYRRELCHIRLLTGEQDPDNPRVLMGQLVFKGDDQMKGFLFETP
jgi:hypothetical protein